MRWLAYGLILCGLVMFVQNDIELNKKIKTQKQEILASIDSIIDVQYGHIKLQQYDWDVLWSQVQYHSFYIVKLHPRSRKKLDGYQNYWHKKLENYNNLIKEIK